MTAKPLSRSGRVYIGCVALVGAVVLTLAILESRSILNDPAQAYPWLILGGLTWASSSFVTRIPGGASIYISEAFVFASMLLFGPGPAVVTMAIDGLLLSLRHRNRTVARYLFHVTEPAITTWMAGLVFKLWGVVPIIAPGAKPELSGLAIPVLGMAGVYFSVNLCLNAIAVMTSSGVGALRAWRTQVTGLGFSTIAGASLGLLIALNFPLSHGVLNLNGASVAALVLIVPLMLISYFTFQTSVARVEDANHHLNELNELYLSTVETLAMAIDAKDQVTHGHIRRVQSYAVGLARALGISDQTELKAIEAAALLHDMGKLSVPEFILNKPGKLTAAEYERMKLHAPVGASILSQINFPYPVVPIVRHHHENWDGTGYPDHITGEDIPLGARIMAVVDCYDALISDRPYRPALTDDQALAIITERRGNMYDPRVVDMFFQVYREIGPAHASEDEVRHHHDLIHVPRAPMHALPEEERPETTGSTTSSADEILLLCELAEGLGGHATLDDVAEVMTRHLRRMVPASLAVFYLVDERSGELVARHASGLGDDRLDGLRMPLGGGLSGWVAANRTTIVNSNPALDLGERLRNLSPLLESALSTPLISENEMIGVLTLYAATRDGFTDDHRRVIELVARQIADAFCRATIFEHELASALRDGATGLPNARSLGQLLASRGFADTQNSLSFGVLCFGCGPDDGASGAMSGEDLLVRVAAATKKVLRATDLVFRYNSHELVILMPDTGPTATWRIARRIVDSVEQTPLGDLPIQIGLAFAPADGRSIDTLLDKARSRLEHQRWVPPTGDESVIAGRAEN